MSPELIWAVAGTLLSVISIAANVVQGLHRRELVKTFRSQVLGLQRELGRASHSANDLRRHTEGIAKAPSEISLSTIRAINILTGDVCGYVEGASEHLQGFAREYLGLALPTRHQIVAEARGRLQPQQ